MTIGQRIRKKREELNMSQEELALKIGYKSRSSINKIELDQYNLQQSKIKAIADALQTTPAYIMGWEEDAEEQKECDLIDDCYENEVFKIVQLILKLDAIDRGKIVERIETMLEDKKYRNKKGSSKKQIS